MKSKVKVIAEEERKNSAYRGGAILSSTSIDCWITRDDYYEYGSSIISKNCYNI
jgi:actin-related protein